MGEILNAETIKFAELSANTVIIYICNMYKYNVR